MKSGNCGTGGIRGTAKETGNYSAGDGKRDGIAGRKGEESKRNRLPSSLPTPRSVSSSEFSEAHRQDRGGGGGSEECVKGDERGRRVKSRGLCDGGAEFQGLSQQLEALELS